MMRLGTLILICGLPGSGKTTLAKKLIIGRQAIRLCADDWVIGVLKDQKNLVERNRLRSPVEQLLWHHAQELLKLGLTVILENGFWSKSERNEYLKTAKQLGARVELHYLTASPKTLWKRIATRNSNPSELKMTKQELANSLQVFEPPTKAEAQNYDLFVTSS